jgi:hypothetical protein
MAATLGQVWGSVPQANDHGLSLSNELGVGSVEYLVGATKLQVDLHSVVAQILVVAPVKFINLHAVGNDASLDISRVPSHCLQAIPVGYTTESDMCGTLYSGGIGRWCQDTTHPE